MAAVMFLPLSAFSIAASFEFFPVASIAARIFFLLSASPCPQWRVTLSSGL